MKAPRSSLVFLSTDFHVHIKQGPVRVKFYRPLSRLLVCNLCAASMHLTAGAQTPSHDINPLALITGDQQHRGRASDNYRRAVPFHFRGAS
jgi:hypothetical protein